MNLKISGVQIKEFKTNSSIQIVGLLKMKDVSIKLEAELCKLKRYFDE